MDGFSFLSIDEAQQGTEQAGLWNGRKNWMERDFEESEVWEVVNNFNGDKAPRRGEFFMAFFLEILGGIKRGYYGGVQGVPQPREV